MKKIPLGDGVYTVEPETGDEAIRWDADFYKGCDLRELRIPEGVTAIARHGLEYCDRLLRVYMPTSVVHLGDAIFYGLRQRIEIHYAGTAEEFRKIGEPRKVQKEVQVPGKYDVQPFCNTEGTYYRTETVTESFDHFCADCHVLCADGAELLYGYQN
ncbi:MAG: hypothetical protein J6V07_04815 [Clostridia bacterium]|nr:hypothetical protein [Clostridia bacterium]